MTPQEYAYRDLVGRIGLGFHPDTRGEDYTSLPEDLTPEAVERIVLEAVQDGVDIYAVALAVLAPRILGLDLDDVLHDEESSRRVVEDIRRAFGVGGGTS